MALNLNDEKPSGKTGGEPSLPGAFAPVGRGLPQRAGGDIHLVPTIGGTKNPKSNLVTLVVKGEKDAGKSCLFVETPRPNKGKTYILTFDDATVAGVTNRYTEEELEDVVIIELIRRQFDDDGNEVYAGYDPNVPETAQKVIGTTMAWLEEIARRGDCDNLILDHFQEVHQNIAVTFAIAETGLDPLANLEFSHYSIRTRAAKMIEAKARGIPKHLFAITGYGEEEKLVMKPKPGGKGSQVVKETVHPRWVEPYKRPYHVVLKLYTTHSEDDDAKVEGGSIETRHWIEVESSKNALFPKGERFDWTEKGIRLFWDRAKRDEEALA